MDISQIKDEDSLRDWLDALPGDEEARRKAAVQIAHRAAMRVSPVAWEWFAFSREAGLRDLTALPILRANLVSGVESTVPNPRVSALIAELSARGSADFARATGDSLVDASDASDAYSAADAASAAAFSVRSTVDFDFVAYASDLRDLPSVSYLWRAVRADCTLIARGADAMAASLWHDMRNPLELSWYDLRTRILSGQDAADWQFWVDWYDRSLSGAPQDWAGLLTDIALIEDALWEQGPAAISARIEALATQDRADPSAPPSTSTPLRAPIQTALAQNAKAIPGQVSGVLTLLDQELERLRGRSPETEIEQQEIARLRDVFLQLRGAVCALGTAFAQGRPGDERATDQVLTLYELYRAEALKWPRDNAADLVDSGWRTVFIGASTGLLLACGAPWLAALGVGGVIFGGKKLAGVAKTVKDTS